MYSFLNTVILLGAVQGSLVSILLFLRPGNQLHHRLLAWLILLMALASFNIYFLHTGFFEMTAVLRTIALLFPAVLVMPMGPLIYFYIRALSEPGFKWQGGFRTHFYPVVIDLLPQLAVILFFTGRAAGWWTNFAPWSRFLDLCNVYSDIPRWISLTVYILLSRKALAARTGTYRVLPANIQWLKQFVSVFLAFQIIWLLYLIPYSIPAYSTALLDMVDWYPVYLPLALMIYWVGIKGYLTGATTVQNGKRTSAAAPELAPDRLDSMIGLLTNAMEQDLLFLDPQLNLERLADHTGLAQKTISRVLNQHLGKSFNEWVNDYRIKEFRKKIASADLRQLTIQGVASGCGFNSQATFQRFFRQSEGMTPTEYIKKLRSVANENLSG